MSSSEPIAAAEPPSGDRITTLIRWGLVLTALGGILLFVYDRVMPHRPDSWTGWWPGLIVAAVVLGALLLGSSRPADRIGRTMDGIALVLGLASTVLSVGAAILITVGLSLNFTEDHASIPTRIFRLTDWRVLSTVLTHAGATAAPGILGLALAHRRRRATGRTSTAAVAYRFSLAGLAVSSVLALAVVVAAIYRWSTWSVF